MDVPVLLLVLLFSVILHECSHGLVAEYFGDPTARELGRLTLNPLSHIDPVGTIIVPLVLALLPGGLVFGWAKPVPVNPARLRDPARQYPLIAAAGPVSNILLATVSAVLLGLLVAVAGLPGVGGGGSLGTPMHRFLFMVLQYGIQLNVLLALFNLIPLPPLDGSWILRRFLGGQALRSYEAIRPFGFFLIVILMMSGMGRFFGLAVHSVSGIFLKLSNAVLTLVG
jgi:Zn-dependent protease